MIDSWFKKDLQNIYDTHPVAVFIDESGDAEFLLHSVESDYTIHITNSEIDELHVKYLIEKEQPSSKKYLIYTNTSKDKLKFIREYCETNGCLEIRYLQNYIKDKIHQKLNLNINLPKDDLITAAKVSIGKDKNYWINLINGTSEVFDLKEELLPFIHSPQTYLKDKYDEQLIETFYRKVNKLLKQEYISKPPQTLAKEVVKVMFDGLSHGRCNKTLRDVYHKWLDSVTYRKSLSNYIKDYKLPEDVDIWSLRPDHPFRSVDEQWFKVIGENITNKERLPNYLSKISRRDKSKQAHALGITFWADVKTLLEFDNKDIAFLNSFSACVEFYTKHFYKLDAAIRNLYTEFLSKKKILEPFQEHYKQIVSVFFDKWFKCIDEYKETQTGILQKIIEENNAKTAVIVGDGVTYEIACKISNKISNEFKLTENNILADLPSETENNMSRIYMANGLTEKQHNKREKYLSEQNPDISIEFIKLDDVNDEQRASQILICTYKDIDSMGEKMQHKALKYFQEAIDYFTEKVEMLLNSGYSKVYLISDHGFVLTGLLSEADKISVSVDKCSDKTERYICTKEKQDSLSRDYILKEKAGKYFYFSKTMNPFKTPSPYGFSHGGASPQELITPYFCWENSGASNNSLTVEIVNKDDLKSVTGELYQLKIQSSKGADDIFSMERKFYLIFFSNGRQVNKSKVFIVKEEKLITEEFTFDGLPEIEVQMLDAETKELLDGTTVKQNKTRDLGGLL